MPRRSSTSLTNPLSGGAEPFRLAPPLCPYRNNTSLTLNQPFMMGDRLDALHMTTNSASMTFGPGEQDDRCPLGSKPTAPVIKEACQSIDKF